MTSSERDRTVAVILAGGRAARFGGVDKAFISLHGEPLVQHVIARAAPQVGAIVINANGPADRFAPFGPPVIADCQAGHPVTRPFLGLVSTIETLRRRASDEVGFLLASSLPWHASQSRAICCQEYQPSGE